MKIEPKEELHLLFDVALWAVDVRVLPPAGSAGVWVVAPAAVTIGKVVEIVACTDPVARWQVGVLVARLDWLLLLGGKKGQHSGRVNSICGSTWLI